MATAKGGATRAALIKASGLTQKRGESDVDFLTRVHLQVADQEATTQETWDSLSEDAQDWNNAMADALNTNTELPKFKDEEEAPEPAKTPGRRAGKTPAANTDAKEPPQISPTATPEAGARGMEKFEPKVGAPVIVTTKRGKVSRGIVVELTDDEIVINEKGEDGEKEADEEFVLANVTVQPQPPSLGATPKEQEDVDPHTPPEVGDTVQVTTARDTVKMGTVVEINIEGDLLVIKDTTGVESEHSIKRLKNCEVKLRAAQANRPAPAPAAGNPAPAPKKAAEAPTAPPAAAPAAGRRRGAAAAAPAAATGGDDDEEGGRAGVGSVVRDTLVHNPNATMEEVEKALTKAGVAFRPVTLKVAYNATKQTVQATIKHHGK